LPAQLLGATAYLPEKTMMNDAFTYLDTSDEWIQRRTGICKRHIIADDETVLSMAITVVGSLLDKLDVDPASIDAVLCATSSAHTALPSVACSVASEHKMGDVFALDFNAACSGLLYGLELIEMGMRDRWQRVILIGVDAMSQMIDWQDRSTCVLFGDGAGALLFEKGDDRGLLGVSCSANGVGAGYLKTDGNMWRDGSCILKMDGREVYKWAVQKQLDVTVQLLDRLMVVIDTVDWCIPHQANKRIILTLAQQLKLPVDKCIITVDQHANTSAASIILALSEGIDNGRICRGHRLLLQAFGSGFTWGAALIDY